ncbi:gluconokinase [Georgenia sp. TF02-10]|uniref:gluconokinase n=1 Tax=Georgenia sp. TF02-10 TaxID=2917725 RepID=UPI001FA7B643|nr:gluconokinase [Georgenia sp. TF02-10]UNX54746.1 gluconokinase [Georgenia sp. TF02-10]
MAQPAPTVMFPVPRRAAGPRHLVVMGVSGGGKTTLAMMLAGKLGYVFAEGDEFHPQANRDKMASGTPLDDDDRAPWLASIQKWMTAEARVGHSTVVTCSALKKKYRDVLRGAEGRTVFVHMAPPTDLTLDRMKHRQGHYMPPSLLDSQIATLEELEPDENGFKVTNTGSPREVLAEVLDQLKDY